MKDPLYDFSCEKCKSDNVADRRVRHCGDHVIIFMICMDCQHEWEIEAPSDPSGV